MSIYSNVTEEDLINLRKLAEQQKNERALKIKNRILKQTHDDKLAESLSPITKKLDEVKKSAQESLSPITKKLEEIMQKPTLEDGNTQTPAIENISGTQSLRDTLTHMKGSKNFFKLQENPDGKIFWNKIPIIPKGENRVSIKGKEFDIKPNIQTYFTNTKGTTKNMNVEDKSTVYDILQNTGFYSMKHTKGLKSARMIDAIYNLPKEIDKIRNPPLPAIENVSDSDLEGQGVKIIIPSNIIDIYIRLEVLLGLKLSGHTDTLTEASNLIDELYKRGEIQNKQQYRNALNKFSTL